MVFQTPSAKVGTAALHPSGPHEEQRILIGKTHGLRFV